MFLRIIILKGGRKNMVSVNELQTELRPVFMSFGIKKAVLFGSVSKGTNTENSDIDIMVDSNLKGLKFLGLLERLKEVSGMEIDLIDVSHIEKNSAVESEIRRTGKIIYEE